MDEAGRCRRTDGKKWRCSKAVIPNQKYCEKHMHRGCRSRKHVEPSVYTSKIPLNLKLNAAHDPPTDPSKPANSKTVEDSGKEGSNGTVTKIVIKSANGTRVKDDDGSRAPQTNDPAAEREDSELRRCRKPDKKRGQCGGDGKQSKKLMHGASKEAD